MKKLRLKALSLGAREILNRKQLKQINGGCTETSQCPPYQSCNTIRNVCEDMDGDPTGSASGGGGSVGAYDCYCLYNPANPVAVFCCVVDDEQACLTACGVGA